MSIVKKESLVDQIYEQLKQSIISLEFPMGSKVNVNELQEIYGVSTTPIREAINRLQKEGLILYENNVGARVITILQQDAWEIDDLAIVLHSAAIRFSMERTDPQVLAQELAMWIQRQREATNEREVVESIFHFIGTFYRYSGNSRLDFNMKLIQGQQLMLRYLYRKEVGLTVRHIDIFEGIYEAVLRQDAEAVIEKYRELSHRAMPVILEALRRNAKGEE